MVLMWGHRSSKDFALGVNGRSCRPKCDFENSKYAAQAEETERQPRTVKRFVLF